MTQYIVIDEHADQNLAHKLLDTNFADTKLAGNQIVDDDQIGIVVTGLNRFSAKDLPAADDLCSNGSSAVHKYDIQGATVIIESGENDGLFILAPNTSIRQFLLWYWQCDDCERCEMMASFGFDYEFTEAEPGDTDVRVWCVPNYYAGTWDAPKAGYVRDDDGEQLVFGNYTDAQAWIDQGEGTYYLAHGEAGRPTYYLAR